MSVSILKLQYAYNVYTCGKITLFPIALFTKSGFRPTCYHISKLQYAYNVYSCEKITPFPLLSVREGAINVIKCFNFKTSMCINEHCLKLWKNYPISLIACKRGSNQRNCSREFSKTTKRQKRGN